MGSERVLVPGYVSLDLLGRGPRPVLYRARAEDSGTSVILKLAPEDVPSHEARAALEREAMFFERSSVEGVPRLLARELHGSRPALVLDDQPGDPLPAVREAGTLGIAARIRLAWHIAGILGDIHQEGVLHLDLNPCNVLVDAATLRASIVDFSFARARGSDEAPAATDRAPAYLAPEQTGRTGWSVDERTDLYALGVTLYELFANRVPFESDDPLEVVHAHIARRPRTLEEIDADVPPQVGALISKLLAKSPENRYQSARGLAADLERALEHVESGGEIPPFELGKKDFGDRLVLPSRLYGRDEEITELEKALARCCDGCGEVLLVEGYSGIGKTSLVGTLADRALEQGGRFVSGKFDQLVRGTPYTAIRQAFGELTRQILLRPDAEIGQWRDTVSEALGQGGQVIVDFLPEVGRILGPQPAVLELGPMEAQNRFNRLFREFLRAVTGTQGPLVLFLDDLQWIDSASRDLMRLVLSNWSSPGLMVVGAFRDNEVGEGHPLIELIEDLRASGTAVSSIRLQPLEPNALRGLVSDALRGDAEHGAPIASLIETKTGGNPFFVTQFMKSLAERDLLVPDRASGVWEYDLEGIETQPSTENVVELLAGRIERLPEAACEALKAAACLGNRFDERTLTIVSGGDGSRVSSGLRVALTGGFVLLSSEDGEASASAAEEDRPGSYRFLHDRVQQAAYALIPEDDRPEVHVAMGRSLLAELSEAEREERASELIDYVRPGLHLVGEGEEARMLLDLAVTAGQKARGQAAYAEALQYFLVAADLSPASGWEAGYEGMFDLHLGIAECEYLSGRFDEGFRTLDGLAERARTPLDGARVQIIRAAQYETMSQYADAVEALRHGLVPLGIDFPKPDAMAKAVEREIDASERDLGDRDIRSLIDLPPLDEASIKMCMRLLAFAWAPSYLLADTEMISWIPARMVRLSLAHGNTEESALGYVVHGFTLGTRRGDYRTGYEFGLLGVELNESLNDLRLRGKVHELFGCFVKQWRSPLADCIESQRTAFNAGLESGDFAYGSYGGFVETWYATLTRDRLEGLEEDYEPVMEFLRTIKNDAFVSAERLILNWSRALRGLTESPLSLDGAGFTEEEFLSGFGQAPFFRVFYDIIKLHLNVTMGRLDDAVREAIAAAEVVHSVSGTIWPMLLRFYRAIAVAGSTEGGAAVSEGLREIVSEDAAQLVAWAENCPENFAHANLLLRAEMARIEGRDPAAEALYDAAIDASQTRGFPGDIALANERYGRYWLERGQHRIGSFFLERAAHFYESWGARPAAARLYGELARAFPGSEAARDDASPGPDLTTPTLDLAPSGDALDFQWAMRAAGALASEIELDGLLKTLTKTLIESAGAERGGLFLGTEEDMDLRIWWDTGTGEVSLVTEPLDAARTLPLSILRYVGRTSEKIVLDDAIADAAFAHDEYVRSCRPRSVLCLPVRHQGQFLGAVYLENSLDRGVFAGNRLRLLETLTAHAAIAIRNSQLFEENARLEERLRAENVYLHEAIQLHHEFEDIIGESPALMRVLEQIEQVAGTDSTVLIQGETGTGKELVARAIHRLSPRGERPLVAVNCGAISPGLVESELFGHEKGAFTGATERRIGRFELADNGTIFLDEIGDLALDLQVKLLRVLQEGEIERVGGTRTIPVDVRVIAGTHRDLETAVKDGEFRPDLFYRLNVFPIRNPPLRERREDIPLLVRYFVMKDGTRLGTGVESIPRRTMDALASYDWPGNVRELRNVIERSLITSRGPAMELGNWLPSESGEPGDEGLLTLDEVQRAHIEKMLQRTGWVVSGPNGAAKRLGMKPTTLEARMKKLDIVRPS